MRSKIWGLLFLLTVPLFGYQVGDTVSFYLDEFRLVLSRDTIPQVGVIRAEGEHCFIVTADRVAVVKIGFIADQIWAATKRLGEEPPTYIYVSDDGNQWTWNRGLSGPDLYADSSYTPAGDLVVNPDMSVYAVMSTPDESGVIQYVIYAATSEGLFRANSLNPGAWETQAMLDTVIYDFVRNPYTADNFLGGLVLYVATEVGPYRVETQGVNQLASYQLLGEGLEGVPVYAIEVLPQDTTKIFAGTAQGLFVKNGNSWEQVTDVPGDTVRQILYDTTSAQLFVAGKFGLYVSSDLGNTWQAKYTGAEVNDILIVSNTTYYIAVMGEGVKKTTDGGSTWEDFSDGLEVLEALGSKNVYTLYLHQDGTLYLGCDEGVYRYDEAQAKWVNVSNGIGSLITDESVGDVLAAFEDPLNTGVSTYEAILDVLGYQPTDLVDVDGEKIFIVLTRLIQTTNATDPTVTPVYGYFDPADEDLFSPTSSKKELFVVDLARFITMGEPGPAKLRAFLAYLMGRYTIWSVDPQEDPAVNTGLAMWAAYKAGFDISDGITGGYDYLNDKAKLNIPLLDYTHQWLNSPVAREIDRERMFLFLEYLSERYGDEAVVEGVAHNLRESGYSLLDQTVRQYSGGQDSLWSFLAQWHLANLMGTYENLDVSVGTEAISLVPSATQTKSVQVLAPTGVAFWKGTASDSVFLQFNAQDDAADYLSLWLIYGDTLVEPVAVDSLGRFSHLIDGSTTNVAYEVMALSLNTSKTYNYYISEDATPPTILGVYSLPNPGHHWVLALFVSGYDRVGEGFYPLHTDVHVAQPTLILRSLADGTQEEYLMTLWAMGDSVFTYTVMANTALRGDLEVQLWAQDRVGNAAVYPPDTLNIQTVGPEGAHYWALGQTVEIEVPEGALFSTRTLVLDRVPSEMLRDRVAGVLEGESPVYSVGSQDLALARPITLRFPAPENATEYTVYRWTGNQWEPVPTWIEGDAYVVTTQRLGLFQVRSGHSQALRFAVRLDHGNILKQGRTLRLTVELPTAEELRVDVYNAAGARIASLAHGAFPAGIHTLTWTPKVSSGVYFLKVRAGNHQISHKLVVLR